MDRELFDEQWAGGREGYTLGKRYVRKDGSVAWVELAASIVRGQGEADAYGVRILRDITEQKSTQEPQLHSVEGRDILLHSPLTSVEPPRQ
jgi:PAS domain S-box-containing protein